MGAGRTSQSGSDSRWLGFGGSHRWRSISTIPLLDRTVQIILRSDHLGNARFSSSYAPVSPACASIPLAATAAAAGLAWNDSWHGNGWHGNGWHGIHWHGGFGWRGYGWNRGFWPGYHYNYGWGGGFWSSSAGAVRFWRGLAVLGAATGARLGLRMGPWRYNHLIGIRPCRRPTTTKAILTVGYNDSAVLRSGRFV